MKTKTTGIDFIEAPVFEGSNSHGTELAYKTIKTAIIKNNNENFCDYVETIVINNNNDSHGTKNINKVVTICENIRLSVLEAFNKNIFPIIVGGDHSIAMGSIAAVSEKYGVENSAIIYIDGHCDINTERTSVSHNIHGMPLGSSLGLCEDTLKVGESKQKVLGENVFIIGARSIDDPEYEIIKNNSVHLYTNQKVTKEQLPQLFSVLKKSIGTKKVHISFDVDSLDPSVLSSTGYIIPNGLSLDLVKEIIEFSLKNLDVVSFEIVEYNPLLDSNKKDINVVVDILNLVRKSVL